MRQVWVKVQEWFIKLVLWCAAERSTAPGSGAGSGVLLRAPGQHVLAGRPEHGPPQHGHTPLHCWPPGHGASHSHIRKHTSMRFASTLVVLAEFMVRPPAWPPSLVVPQSRNQFTFVAKLNSQRSSFPQGPCKTTLICLMDADHESVMQHAYVPPPPPPPSLAPHKVQSKNLLSTPSLSARCALSGCVLVKLKIQCAPCSWCFGAVSNFYFARSSAGSGGVPWNDRNRAV